MEDDHILYYVDENVAQPLMSSNHDPSVSSDFFLSALKPRDHQTVSKKRIVRNLLMMCSSLFVFFLGFQSLQNLQSTMNSADGVGMESQAVIFASSMLSSVFMPEILIKTFGCKRTLVMMFMLGVPYFLSNFYPKYEIIMPSSVLMGLAISPLNAAAAFYINEMALRYFKVTMSDNLETIVARFFGILSFFMENTQIWGNLVSYYILRPGVAPILNHTNSSCGIHFRTQDSEKNPNLQPPTDEQRYILVSFYLLSAIIATVLMGLFMDKLENDIKTDDDGEGKCRFIIGRLLAAAKHAAVPEQIFLIPVTIFTGLELAFYTGEITQAYIACSWGVHHVGFVTICFGVCGALMSLLVGPLVKWISQMAVLILAACANVGTCILLFLWEPSPDSTFTYFLIAGIWGMGDAIWWSQVTALYGLMFPNDREAAFSNLYFWSFLGFFLSYSYANYLTVAVKINILLCFLITGMIGYLVGQAKIKCTAKREYVPISQGE